MMDTGSEYIGPVNLGNSSEISILELAEKTIRLVDSKSKIIHVELPMDDPVRRRLDITKAKKDLAWEPVIPLEEGLKKLLSISERFCKMANNVNCDYLD